MGHTDHASNNLNKTLTLKDLVLFGVISIFGSGGFNLIGRAITQGGPQWPELTCKRRCQTYKK